MKKISLRFGLVVTFIVLISFPIVISSLINYNHVTKVMGDQVEENSNLLISEIETELNNYFEIYRTGASLLALDENLTHPAQVKDKSETLTAVLEQFVQIYPDVSRITIGYVDQSVVTYPSLSLPDDYDLNHQPWYTQTLATNHSTLTSSVVDLTHPNAPLFKATTAVPIIASGQLIGVLALEMDLSKIASKLSQVQFGEKGYPVLMTNDGIVVTHKNLDLLGKKVLVPELEAFIANHTSGSFEYVYDSVEKIAFLRTIGDNGWKVLVTLPQDELIADAKHVVLTNVKMGLILLIITFIIVFMINRFVDQSISKLLKRVNYLSHGDFTSRPEHYVLKEFHTLSDIIEKMVEKVSNLIFNAQSTATAVKYVSFTITNYTASNLEDSLTAISESVQKIDELLEHTTLTDAQATLCEEVKNASHEACRIIKDQKSFADDFSKLAKQLDAVTDTLQTDVNQFII